MTTETGRTYTPDTTLPDAWVVDVDGTLARMSGRSPFDWSRVGEDEPVEAVVTLVRHLAGPLPGDVRGPEILVVSGRDRSCYDATRAWLIEHGIPHAILLMRPAGDQRKDSIVKEEIFWRDIAPRWNVRGVVDDRDQVVAMWRSLGLMCAQVAPGAF